MQRNEKQPTDARTFVEIWQHLSLTDRVHLTGLIASKCGTSRQAVWYWGRGERKPSSLLVKREVARVMAWRLGSNVDHKTLFPAD